LPGSGKTTLAKKIASERGFTIVKIRNRRELLTYNFLYLLKHPLKFFITLGYILLSSRSPKLFYLKFMNCFLVHNAKFEKAKRYEKAIIDQGHWQNIISVFDYPLGTKKLERYIKYLPSPDLLVVVEAEEEVRSENLSRRGYSSRQEYKKEYVEKWKEGSKNNYLLFLSLAEHRDLSFEVVKNSEGRFIFSEYLSGLLG